MSTVRFLPDAEIELLHEVEQYSAAGTGVGVQFRPVVEAAVHMAPRHLRGGSLQTHGVRAVLVRGLPFSVAYRAPMFGAFATRDTPTRASDRAGVLPALARLFDLHSFADQDPVSWTPRGALCRSVKRHTPACGGLGQTETVVVVRVGRGVPVAVGRAHPRRIVVPRAAAEHAAVRRTGPCERRYRPEGFRTTRPPRHAARAPASS